MLINRTWQVMRSGEGSEGIFLLFIILFVFHCVVVGVVVIVVVV